MQQMEIGQNSLPAFIMIVPLLIVLFTWISVTHWINARAAERRTRERYALFKHLSERPAESVQLVLEQLHQDDARELEREREKAAVVWRGQNMGAAVTLAIGILLTLFLYYIAPNKPLWLIGLMPVMVGVILAVSGWLEKPKGQR